MELISLPYEGEIPGIDSRYRVVSVVSQRARQLFEGAKPSVSTKYSKPTSIALQELCEGKLEFLTGDEAALAQKEARRLKEEGLATRAIEARHAALSDEIKRDLTVYMEEGKPKEETGPKEESSGAQQK